MLIARVWEEKRQVFKAIVISVLRDPAGADDVLQEAFARVLSSNKEFHSQPEAYHYLRTAVLNTAIDVYRRVRRYRRRHSDKELIPSKIETGEADPLSLLIQAQELSEKTQLINEIQAALNYLSPQQQEAIQIFFASGQGTRLKDICRNKGVPYSTLRSRMLKGLDRIRTHLRENGVSGFDSKGNET